MLTLKPSPAGGRTGLHAKRRGTLDAQGLRHDDVAVTRVPGGGAPPRMRVRRASLGRWNSPDGMRAGAVPAPDGSPGDRRGDVRTAQCQKPDPLGASGRTRSRYGSWFAAG